MNDLVGHARGVVEGRRVVGFRVAATPAKPSSDAVNSAAGKAMALLRRLFIKAVTKQNDGSFTGNLKTLNVTASLVVVPVDKMSENAPDYRVYAGNGQRYEVGAGWSQVAKSSGETYLNLKIAAPEFRPNRVRARLVKLEMPMEDGTKRGSVMEEGGLQQQRHPSLAEEEFTKSVEPGQPELPGLDADESDVVADKRALDRLSRPARVYGVNEAMGPDKDILEGFRERAVHTSQASAPRRCSPISSSRPPADCATFSRGTKTGRR